MVTLIPGLLHGYSETTLFFSWQHLDEHELLHGGGEEQRGAADEVEDRGLGEIAPDLARLAGDYPRWSKGWGTAGAKTSTTAAILSMCAYL